MRSLLLPCAIGFASGCSLFAPAVSEGEGDVVGEGEGEGDVVGEGEGDVVGEGEGEAVTIVAVDGDGSALAVNAADVPAGVAAEHRVRQDFIVAGNGLAAVVGASLVDATDHATALEILPMIDAQHRGFRLRTAVAPGLFTLVLSTLGAAPATAQVFLLQGEPGPAGRDGVDGAPGRDGVDGADGAPGIDGVDGAPGRDGVDGALTKTLLGAAAPAECPLGGRAVVSFVDADNNGAVDPGEQVSRSVLCDNAVTAPVTLPVANAADLASLMTSLRSVSIVAPVIVQLPSTMVMTTEVDVSHRDGRNLTIRGPCTITSSGAVAFRVTRETTLEAIDLVSGRLRQGNGIVTEPDARGRFVDVSAADFQNGIFMEGGDFTLVRAAFVNNFNALTAQRGARVDAVGAVFNGDENACSASQGAQVNLTGFDADGVVDAVVATFGAVVDASTGNINASGKAIFANTNSTVRMADTGIIGTASFTVSDVGSAFVRGTTAAMGARNSFVLRGGTIGFDVPGGTGAVSASSNSTAFIEPTMTCTPTTSGVCVNVPRP